MTSLESRTYEPSLRLGGRGIKAYAQGTGVQLPSERKTIVYGKYVVKYVPLGGTLRISSRLLQELTLLRKLNHPHIIELLDLGILTTPPTLYQVFPLCNFSLRDLLQREISLPLFERENLAYQILSAIAYLHERGILHGSLSPTKILINRHEDGHDAIISCFENSRELSVSQTRILTSRQTYQPPYLSPESIDSLRREGRAILSRATDLWALGALMYELLSEDEPLFLRGALEATNHLDLNEYYLTYSEGVYTRLEEADQWLPLIPKTFQETVENILSPRAEDRPQASSLIPEGWHYQLADLSRPLRKGERLSTRLAYPNNPHSPEEFLALKEVLLRFSHYTFYRPEDLSRGLGIYESYRSRGYGTPLELEVDFLASVLLAGSLKNFQPDPEILKRETGLNVKALENRGVLIAHHLTFDFAQTLPLDYLIETPTKDLLEALLVVTLTPARFSFFAPELLEGAVELSKKFTDKYLIFDSPILRTFESEILSIIPLVRS